MPEITQEQLVEFEKIINENIELKKDIQASKGLIMGFLKLIGLSDGTAIHHKFLLDESHEDYRSPMLPVINAMTSFATDAMKAKMPGLIGKKAEEKLKEKFQFVNEHYYLIEKYGK